MPDARRVVQIEGAIRMSAHHGLWRHRRRAYAVIQTSKSYCITDPRYTPLYRKWARCQCVGLWFELKKEVKRGEV